jgi:L-lactate utilization protein LutB
MDFMLEHQAQFTVNFQKADERFKASESRLDRLERVLMLAIHAGQRERKETREKFNTLAEAMSKMAEAQTHTDQRLDALIDIIQEGRNGNGSK